MDDALRTAGEAWRAARPPARTSVDPALFEAARPARPNRTLATLAGAAVIALLGILIVISLPPRDQHVATGSPSPLPSGSASALPTSSAQTPLPSLSYGVLVDGVSWTDVSLGEPPTPGARVASVQTIHGQFFAYWLGCGKGSTECDSKDRTYYPLTSSDGETWTALPSISISAPVVHFNYDDGLGYVATATFFSGPGAGLWHWTDGTSWEWLGDKPGLGDGVCSSSAIDAINVSTFFRSDNGLIASGLAYCTASIDQGAWTSADGSQWARTDIPPVEDVLERGGKWVGASRDGTWTSDDGREWNQSGPRSWISQLLPISTGLIGITSDPNIESHTLWLLPDGGTWQAGKDIFHGSALDSFSSDGSRTVVMEPISDATGSDAVWVSSGDATAWARHALPGQTSLRDFLSSQGKQTTATLGDRVVALGNNNSLWVADIPTPTSAVPTPSTSPTPARPTAPATPLPASTPVELGLDWTRQDGEVPSDVGSFSDGFVGIACGDCSKQQQLRVSVDGSSWTDIPQAIEGQTGQLFTADGALMAGVVVDPTAGTTHDVSVWKWDNGWTKTYEGTIDTSGCANGGQSLGSFVASGEVTVVHGTDAVWSATDGGWECTGDQPNVFVAAGHGVFVGAGAQTSSDADERFWRSADGVTWEALGSAPWNTRMAAVADGFVAIGGADGHSAPNTLLTSVDGQTWTQQPYPFGPVGLRLAHIATDGSRAVVVEDSDDPATTAPGAVWVSSSNGSQWSRYLLPANPRDYASSVAILGNRLVVAGLDEGGDQPSGLIWTATLP